ncbi:hypothetical protein MKK65_09755 [Methylobacterium sp. J-001]|uniref:hypothetical protein n=1 Tax=Methylobacterium sp. J-001 TaxID=2836609 RepID=UPI001FBADDC0|nr:hypothetical protein [Methylobacterium sp. J-001]MCJ2116849.1 hypothetical protein [Methylobacterium sp. J-001]
MSGSDKPESQTLRTLAGILGVSVKHFFDGALASDGTADSQECLRLWSCIRTDEGRQRALTYLRGILEDEQR